jgi:hypothetical protein
MKVIFSVTVEVDKDEWASCYGIDNTAQAVKDDVRETLLQTLEQLTDGNHGAGDGAIKSVTPRY